MKMNRQGIDILFKRFLCGIQAAFFHATAIGFLCLMSILGLSGCHISWPFAPPASLIDNARFMEMWKTYQHCRASADLGEIWADFQQLNYAASQVAIEQNQDSTWLPVPIRSLMSSLPSRLAVDPYAMTMACVQHGNQAAQIAAASERQREVLTAGPKREVVHHVFHYGGRELPYAHRFEESLQRGVEQAGEVTAP